MTVLADDLTGMLRKLPAVDWLQAGIRRCSCHQCEGGDAAAVSLEQILAIIDRVAMQDAASLMARQERQRNITESDGLSSIATTWNRTISWRSIFRWPANSRL